MAVGSAKAEGVHRHEPREQGGEGDAQEVEPTADKGAELLEDAVVLGFFLVSISNLVCSSGCGTYEFFLSRITATILLLSMYSSHMRSGPPYFFKNIFSMRVLN